MANVVQHSLEAIEVEGRQLHDALRVVLHTILFARALGAVNPRELSPASFPGLSYATCGNADVDRSVEQTIERFIENLTLVGPELVRGELQLLFYDTRKRPGFLGIGAAREERVYWERWTIPMIVSNAGGAGGTGGDAAEAALRANLFRVLQLCNDLAHVPAMRGEESDALVFKYELTVTPRSGGNGKDGGMAQELLTKILPKGPTGSMRFNL